MRCTLSIRSIVRARAFGGVVLVILVISAIARNLYATSYYCTGICQPGTYQPVTLTDQCEEGVYHPDLDYWVCTGSCVLDSPCDVYVSGPGCLFNEEPTTEVCTHVTYTTTEHTYDTDCDPGCYCIVAVISDFPTEPFVTCATSPCPLP